MMRNREAVQWNDMVEHRDDPDGLNAATGIINATLMSALFWAPVIWWFFG